MPSLLAGDNTTLGTETRAKFRGGQALLRRAISDGNPAAVLDRAQELFGDGARTQMETFATGGGFDLILGNPP